MSAERVRHGDLDGYKDAARGEVFGAPFEEKVGRRGGGGVEGKETRRERQVCMDAVWL